MAERKISEKSLANLKRSNQESNAITRESLEISLLQLLDKKDLKKITISELVERAGVSRAAFYRNYESKEDRIISLAVDYNFEKLLTKAVYEFLEKRSKSQKSSQGPASYLNSFLSSAIVSVLAKWIKDGMKVPAEKMASLGLPLFPQKKRK